MTATDGKPTLCQSGSVLLMAGQNVDSAISGATLSGAELEMYAVDEWILQAEAIINTATRFNWITSYTTYTSGTKLILQNCAAAIAANECIKYNMSTYTSRVEAEDMININRDSYLRDLSLLRDKKNQRFIHGGT